MYIVYVVPMSNVLYYVLLLYYVILLYMDSSSLAPVLWTGLNLSPHTHCHIFTGCP